jgi:hypothetical protein
MGRRRLTVGVSFGNARFYGSEFGLAVSNSDVARDRRDLKRESLTGSS